MKNILALILTALILIGCNLPGVTNQTVSEADLSTRVAQILTSFPTQTPAEKLMASTSEPSTLTQEPGKSPEIETALPPTLTPSIIAPSETLSPTINPPTSLPPAVAKTTPPTLTPGANDPLRIFGSPMGTDPMNKGEDWGWGSGANEFTSMTFNGTAMRLTGLTPKAGWRIPVAKPSDNFYVEMTATLEKCTAKDNYGIIFRVPKYDEPVQGYLFSISCDGYYKLWLWDGLADTDGASKQILSWKANPIIRSGAEQSNRIGVLAVGKNIYLYINGTRVNETVDATFSSGSFGIFIDPDTTQNLTVRIDEMSYWNNPTQ
jgi:hypothetical protein